MITTVTLEKAEFLPPPQRFEAGTQRVSQAIALAAAVRWFGGLDREAGPRTRTRPRSSGVSVRVRSIDGIRLLGDTDAADRVALQAFDVEGVHAHDVGQFLDSRGVAVRVGHHCAPAAAPPFRPHRVGARERGGPHDDRRDRHLPGCRLRRPQLFGVHA